MAGEKTALLRTRSVPPPRVVGSYTNTRSRWRVPLMILLAITLVHTIFHVARLMDLLDFDIHDYIHRGNDINSIPHCDQVSAIHPQGSTDKMDDTIKFMNSKTYYNASVKYLSEAVQIPSVSYDDIGKVGEDDRWKYMYDFVEFLEKTFPAVHDKLKLEKIHELGLLYTWEGSDKDLKPTLFMAHYDVVPVAKATENQWTHPPFSGHYDGKDIWGRGSSDDKNQLIAQLEAITLLLQADFKPRRTIILSFGFDEEISGGQGASNLAPFIHDRYGDDSIAVIVDEGSGYLEQWGSRFIAPGVGEKGYVDIYVDVTLPGGHSSVPPPHTGIGIMSELIHDVEVYKYRSFLADNNPVLGQMICGLEHSPSFPKTLRRLLERRLRSSSRGSKSLPWKRDPLAEELAKTSDFVKYLMTTSIAADVVIGGVKANALPETVHAILNHRVNIGSEVSDVLSRIEGIGKHIAKKHNLTLHAFSDSDAAPASVDRILSLRAISALEPAPVSPTTIGSTSSNKRTPWHIFSGTTRAMFGEDIILAPGLMTGNTDTKYYWALTKNIFRFTPSDILDYFKIHTVDERTRADGHLQAVKWYFTFLRNMDEADLE